MENTHLLDTGNSLCRRNGCEIIVPIATAELPPFLHGVPDIIECRLDLIDIAAGGDIELLKKWRRALPEVPLLATIRSTAEYGRWRGRESERLRRFTALTGAVEWVDVELAATIAAELCASAHAAGTRLIASWHGDAAEFTYPSLLRRATAIGADVLKLAIVTDRLEQLLPMAELLARGDSPLPIIAVGMGRYGQLSRLLYPLLGSCAVYACHDLDSAVVPGQLPMELLRQLLQQLFALPNAEDALAKLADMLLQAPLKTLFEPNETPQQLRDWLQARPWQAPRRATPR